MSSTMHQEYKIAGVSVSFPCKPYPSQFSMMDKIIRGIDRRQNCLIESPTGSGKSLALLCSALAWQTAEKAKQDLIENQEEVGVCSCSCQNVQGQPSVQTQAEMKQETPCPVNELSNDEDDFKILGKEVILQPDPKNPGRHISIAYENGQPSPLLCAGQPTSESICTCMCDDSSADRKVKIKIAKIYFGTRTHKQVAQIIRELRKTKYHDVRMTVLGSREFTCIHPQISNMANKNEACKELLNGGGCHLKDGTQRLTSQNAVRSMGLDTAWDLEDLVRFGRKKRACPYFLSRGLKEEADLIICPYNYLVDPIVREAMQISLKSHIVILDEAHNIEDSAREAASQSFTQDSIVKGIKDIDLLMEANVNLADHSKLRSMLQGLDKFIDSNKDTLEHKEFDRAYKVWSGFHIVAELEAIGLGLNRFQDYKKALIAIKSDAEERREAVMKSGKSVESLEMKPATFSILEQIFQVLDYLYRSDLKYVDDYRASLSQTQSYVPANNDNQWLNSKFVNGGRRNILVDVLTLHFWCMNPGVAFSDFSETRSIILTSGTLSPLASFESELGLEFKVQLETNHVIDDSQVWVGTLGQGPSGSKLQAVFRNLETFQFQDELGRLILRVSKIVPYGVLCFLPSYSVLDKLMNRWESTGLKTQLEQHKLVIKEPKFSDKVNFENQLNLFYQATESETEDQHKTKAGGALFFAVCRGKVSEGLDFADNFARAVITVGIPYPNFKDVQVDLKKKYNDQHRQSRKLLSGSEWYEIQAFRALNQALGRCIRHRNDWGALIIVDDRFVKTPDKYCKGLSKWVRSKTNTFQNFETAMESLSKFTSTRLALTTYKDSSDPPSTQSQNLAESPMKQSTESGQVTVKSISPLLTFDQKSLSNQMYSIFNLSTGKKTRAPESSSKESELKASPKSNLHKHYSNSDSSCVLDSVSDVAKLSPRLDFKEEQILLPKPSSPRQAPREEPGLLLRPALTTQAVEQRQMHKGSNVVNDVCKSGTSMPAGGILQQQEVEQAGGIKSNITVEGITQRCSDDSFSHDQIIQPKSCDSTGLSASLSNQSVSVTSSDVKISGSPSAMLKNKNKHSHRAGNTTSNPAFKSLLPYSIDLPPSRLYQQLPPSSRSTRTDISPDETSSKCSLSTVNQLNTSPTKTTDSHPGEPAASTLSPSRQAPAPSPATPVISVATSSSDKRTATGTQSYSKSKLNIRNTRPLFTNKTVTPPSLVDTRQNDHSSTERKPLSSKKLSCGQDTDSPKTKVSNKSTHRKSSLSPSLAGSIAQDSRRSALTQPFHQEDDCFVDSIENSVNLLVRRKMRGTKRKHLSFTQKSECKQDKEPDHESQILKETTVACSLCGHTLVTSSQHLDQRAVPSFLRESEANSAKGCVLLPGSWNTDWTPPDSGCVAGGHTKFIEQEDICVQFLYCGPCWQLSPGTSSVVGAQVKLATGSGARYSKGQTWMFLNAVSQKTSTAPESSPFV